MSQDPTPAQTAVGKLEGGAGGPQSAADRLLEKRRETQAKRKDELELILPGGCEVLVVRRVRTKSVQQAVTGKGALESNIALLVDHTKRVMVRDPDTAETATVADGINQTLKAAFNLHGQTPAQILVSLYGNGDLDWAINKHAIRLEAWSSGEDIADVPADDIDQLLGPTTGPTIA